MSMSFEAFQISHQNLALSRNQQALLETRRRLHGLNRMRGGLQLKKGLSAIGFCAHLARLMQDIARAKLEELRLLFVADHLEKELSAALHQKKKMNHMKHLALGNDEPPQTLPPKRKSEPNNRLGFILAWALLRRTSNAAP